MRKTILTLLLIAAAATVASAQSATNFLVNPGFEIGYSGQWSGQARDDAANARLSVQF